MQAIDFYYSGIDEVRKGNFQEAIQYLEHSSQMDEHYKTYEWLYLIWKKLGNSEKAFPCLEKAFALNPSSDSVSVSYAGELALRGETAKAREILQETIQRNATYLPAVRLLEAIS